MLRAITNTCSSHARIAGTAVPGMCSVRAHAAQTRTIKQSSPIMTRGLHNRSVRVSLSSVEAMISVRYTGQVQTPRINKSMSAAQSSASTSTAFSMRFFRPYSSVRGPFVQARMLTRSNGFFWYHSRHSTPLDMLTKSNTPLNRQSARGMTSNALQRFAGNFSVDSSNKVVYTIVAINVAIFATWQYAEENAKRFRDGRLYYFMYRNFTDSAQNLREGRVWTLVTSAFSHKEWYHILLNSMVLLSFGDPVWRLLGTTRFLTVYLGSAITASLSSIAYYSHLEPYLRKMQHKPRGNAIHYSMGASGSLMGITTAFACVYPMSQYSLFFVINMPAAALIGLFGAFEIYNVLAVNTGRFDSAGHLGGGLFGAAYYLTRLRPFIRIMGRR